jgi:hypothetical protein
MAHELITSISKVRGLHNFRPRRGQSSAATACCSRAEEKDDQFAQISSASLVVVTVSNKLSNSSSPTSLTIKKFFFFFRHLDWRFLNLFPFPVIFFIAAADSESKVKGRNAIRVCLLIVDDDA